MSEEEKDDEEYDPEISFNELSPSLNCMEQQELEFTMAQKETHMDEKRCKTHRESEEEKIPKDRIAHP